ncbi:MAG: glycosyl transferase family 4, partial [Pseudomonadota bacterium]
MAAAQAVVSGLFLLFAFLNAGETALALAAATVAGAALGFLPWNFPLARVFMGDAGSVPLGCLLGGLCLAAFATGALPGTSALLILAVFYTDAGLTLLGRFWRGERWYTAHRKHAYQRLIAQGWTHGQVLFMYVALNFAVVAPAVITSVWRPELSVAVTVGAYGLLALLWGAVSLKLGEGP